jgi:hypothetical protein
MMELPKKNLYSLMLNQRVLVKVVLSRDKILWLLIVTSVKKEQMILLMVLLLLEDLISVLNYKE